MEQKSLERIVADLHEEEQRLQRAQENLSNELEKTTKELNRVREASSALTGKGGNKVKRGKPSPKKDDVRVAVRNALSAQGVVESKQLSKIVASELSSRGLSKAGLALRLREVLSEEEFVDTPSGVHFKESSPEAFHEHQFN